MVRGGGGIDTVTGGSAADIFVFDKKVAGSYMIVHNMGTGADTIGLDTDTGSTLTTNAFDTTGALTNGGNITRGRRQRRRCSPRRSRRRQGRLRLPAGYRRALLQRRTATSSGGGILIGVITTNGSTPWTYDFTKFTSGLIEDHDNRGRAKGGRVASDAGRLLLRTCAQATRVQVGASQIVERSRHRPCRGSGNSSTHAQDR